MQKTAENGLINWLKNFIIDKSFILKKDYKQDCDK